MMIKDEQDKIPNYELYKKLKDQYIDSLIRDRIVVGTSRCGSIVTQFGILTYNRPLCDRMIKIDDSLP